MSAPAWKVGDRVVVAIPRENRKLWAAGAAEALEGMTGTVEEIHEKRGGVCVRFDKPAPTWWAYQSPPKAHWFMPEELRAEAKPVALPTLLVSWENREVQIVARDQFLIDNAEDAFTCAAVLALKPGDPPLMLGGGASPELVIALMPEPKS